MKTIVKFLILKGSQIPLSWFLCRDISFLYDVPQEFAHPEKPDPHDHSSVRKNAELPPKKVFTTLPK